MPSIPPGPNVAAASAFRTDHWHSRKHAAASFRKSPLFVSFHPNVLEKYITYGLREAAPTPSSSILTSTSSITPSSPPSEQAYPTTSPKKQEQELNGEQPVTLTTPSAQEVFTFVRTNFPPSAPLTPRQYRLLHPDLSPSHTNFPFTRPECANILNSLPAIRPRVCYIFSPQSMYLPSTLQDEIVSATGTGVGGNGSVVEEGAVEKILVKRGGHFAPFVAVDEVAGILASKIGNEVNRWQEEKTWLEGYDSGRSERTEEGKVVVSQGFKELVKGDRKRRKTSKL
ncbi:MAG: hypothetical protein Q9220_006204 [cf. Caloplaca sp. 1 TL-2023]